MHTHLHLYIQVNTELRPFASFVTPVAENGARGRSTKTSRCNCCDSCCGGFQVGGDVWDVSSATGSMESPQTFHMGMDQYLLIPFLGG